MAARKQKTLSGVLGPGRQFQLARHFMLHMLPLTTDATARTVPITILLHSNSKNIVIVGVYMRRLKCERAHVGRFRQA